MNCLIRVHYYHLLLGIGSHPVIQVPPTNSFDFPVPAFRDPRARACRGTKVLFVFFMTKSSLMSTSNASENMKSTGIATCRGRHSEWPALHTRPNPTSLFVSGSSWSTAGRVFDREHWVSGVWAGSSFRRLVSHPALDKRCGTLLLLWYPAI